MLIVVRAAQKWGYGMGNVIASDNPSMSGAPCASAMPFRTSGECLPLAMVGPGKMVHVARIRGNETLVHHLAELGFVPGVRVRVVSSVHGDIVVGVRGSQFGLDRKTAMRILIR